MSFSNAKISSFGSALPFAQVFKQYCKIEHSFFFREGHEANIKVMDT